jgi:hypothetical protein
MQNLAGNGLLTGRAMDERIVRAGGAPLKQPEDDRDCGGEKSENGERKGHQDFAGDAAPSFLI